MSKERCLWLLVYKDEKGCWQNIGKRVDKKGKMFAFAGIDEKKR